MKKIMLAMLLFASMDGFSQDLKNFRLYNPEADAAKGIEAAIVKAKASGKHVLLQVGGNWCIWCMRFNDFTTKDAEIDSLVNASYVVYHLNYSKENMNKAILAKYKFPQRFGFPVFLVLDGNGQLLHTQNSALLEDAATKSYHRENVLGFFRDWTPAALNPANYKE